MNKYVTKTTKEYFYNEEGYLVKEVKTEEYYEYEVDNEQKSPVKTGQIRTDSVDTSKWFRATGEPPTATFNTDKADTSGIVHGTGTVTSAEIAGGQLKFTPNAKTVNEIAQEVKRIIDEELSRNIRKSSLTNDKAL